MGQNGQLISCLPVKSTVTTVAVWISHIDFRGKKLVFVFIYLYLLSVVLEQLEPTAAPADTPVASSPEALLLARSNPTVSEDERCGQDFVRDLLPHVKHPKVCHHVSFPRPIPSAWSYRFRKNCLLVPSLDN